MLRATFLAILLGHNWREKLPSVTYPATCLQQTLLATFLLLQSLREVELVSTFRNAATDFSSVVKCNMLPATCVATSGGISQ